MQVAQTQYADQAEILSVFHAWQVPRTTHGVDLTIPLVAWPRAMWHNLARRVELEGRPLFGVEGYTPLRLTSAPPRPGQAATFVESGVTIPGRSFSLTLEQESPEDSPVLTLARSDGWHLAVFWDYRPGQGDLATWALHALTGELGRSARKMLTEGFLYECPGTKRECVVKLVKHPTHSWVWRVTWGLPKGEAGEFCVSPAGVLFTANGGVDDNAPLPAGLGRRPTEMTAALSHELDACTSPSA